jgi:hypothetical protein
VEEIERRRATVARDEWLAIRDQLLQFLSEARSFEGLTEGAALNLKKGESVLLQLDGSCLIEPRRLPGQWAGRSSGYSFRVMKGLSYRVGGNRGTYLQGEEQPQVVDQGVISITNRRVVFQGTKASREWLYSKLLGSQHVDLPGEGAWTALQVSNRQKVSGFLYTDDVAPQIQFRLALGLAHFNGDVDRLAAEIENQLAEHVEDEPPALMP